MYGKLSKYTIWKNDTVSIRGTTKYLFKYLVAWFDLNFFEKSFNLVLFQTDIGTAVFRFNQGIV